MNEPRGATDNQPQAQRIFLDLAPYAVAQLITRGAVMSAGGATDI